MEVNVGMDSCREEEFYKKEGYPTEYLSYCDYWFVVSDGTPDYGIDYDQFALVKNALYPYIRLTRRRGSCHYPNGGSSIIAKDGSFARKSDAERDEECPKIAWGLAAEFIAYLNYDRNQKDYVPKVEIKVLIVDYYKRYWEIYKKNHNGLKFSKITIEQKELNFLSEHGEIEQKLWDKSTPLKAYPTLYDYAKDAGEEYKRFLLQRKKDLEDSMKPNNNYNTEICSAPNGPYIRVFFLDDRTALKAKDVVEAVNSVKKVNSGVSQSSSHPGQYLIVYLKPMVTAEYCEREIHEALDLFFSNSQQMASVRMVKTDAYFDNIEKQVINDLKGARVSILIAMAWFTNQRIADVLIEKYREGLDVKVVSFDDHVNSKFGVDIDAIPHKKVKSPRGGIMHDKFCVIDNQKVLTGSYNWSVNAENKNVENVPVIYDDARASDYSVEFRKLFESV